jgi:hypothetical protein
MKDREIADVVNYIRDLAVKYHGHQCLRELISQALVPMLSVSDCNVHFHHDEVEIIVNRPFSSMRVTAQKEPDVENIEEGAEPIGHGYVDQDGYSRQIGWG